jgi:hypothetical protein
MSAFHSLKLGSTQFWKRLATILQTELKEDENIEPE